MSRPITVITTIRLLLPLAVVGILYVETSVPFVASNLHPPLFTVEPSQASTFSSTSPSVIYDPTQLTIPSIGLTARVQKVGRTVRGAMAIPTNFTDVGWYRDGVFPGQPGNAVIDGHVDNGLGLPAVFAHLDQVQIGDMIYVQDKNGMTISFTVSAVHIYEYDSAPLDTIFGQSDVAMLNLITCSGRWIPMLHTDSHRLVVSATRNVVPDIPK